MWSRHLSMHVNLFHSFRLHTDMDSACKRLRSSTIKNCPTPIWRQTKSRHRGCAASDWQFTQGNGVKVLLFTDINCIVVLVFCLSQHNCYCNTLKFKCTERYWALIPASFWFLSLITVSKTEMVTLVLHWDKKKYISLNWLFVFQLSWYRIWRYLIIYI